MITVTCDNPGCRETHTAPNKEALMATASLEGWTWYRARMHCGACPTWCEEKCGRLADDEDGLCDTCYVASK